MLSKQRHADSDEKEKKVAFLPPPLLLGPKKIANGGHLSENELMQRAAESVLGR
jgi:hypothetical protein